MGIVNSIFECFRGVECHYDEKCTYQKLQETNKIRKWKRKCVCRRRLSAKTVQHGLYTDLRKETKHGSGGRWFELTWIHYGGNSTSYARYGYSKLLHTNQIKGTLSLQFKLLLYSSGGET